MAISLENRQRIKELRADGLTYAEIQQAMGMEIPKSTLSYICRGVTLPAYYEHKLAQLNKKHMQLAQTQAVAKNRALQAERLEALIIKNERLFDSLGQYTLKIALAMLYLGEGSKRRSYRGLSLGSSDPTIVNLYIKLLKRCYDISPDRLRARVQCRADQSPMQLENYWSEVTGLRRDQFYKTTPDPRTKGKRAKSADYRGVCVIICAGTDIQLELAIISQLLLEKMGH